MQIAILITTFLRDSLLYKTLETIVSQSTETCITLIADQGYSSSEKDTQIDYFKSQIPLEYHTLPFDCGLSAARNYLVRIANEKNIPYILMLADSIQFSQIYDFQPVIAFLEQDNKKGLVGFLDEGRKAIWEYDMEITPRGIKFSISDNYVEFMGIKYLKVDICNNIFLAKTNTLLNLWDEELKLGEHEDAFLAYKKRGYEVYWTDKYVFKKISSNTSEEYRAYRNRLPDYLKLVKQKYNMNSWVIYPPKKEK
jgi:hypothetical protein